MRDIIILTKTVGGGNDENGKNDKNRKNSENAIYLENKIVRFITTRNDKEGDDANLFSSACSYSQIIKMNSVRELYCFERAHKSLSSFGDMIVYPEKADIYDYSANIEKSDDKEISTSGAKELEKQMEGNGWLCKKEWCEVSHWEGRSDSDAEISKYYRAKDCSYEEDFKFFYFKDMNEVFSKDTVERILKRMPTYYKETEAHYEFKPSDNAGIAVVKRNEGQNSHTYIIHTVVDYVRDEDNVTLAKQEIIIRLDYLYAENGYFDKERKIGKNRIYKCDAILKLRSDFDYSNKDSGDDYNVYEDYYDYRDNDRSNSAAIAENIEIAPFTPELFEGYIKSVIRLSIARLVESFTSFDVSQYICGLTAYIESLEDMGLANAENLSTDVLLPNCAKIISVLADGFELPKLDMGGDSLPTVEEFCLSEKKAAEDRRMATAKKVEEEFVQIATIKSAFSF